MKDFTEARNNFTHIKFNIYFHVLLFMIHLQSYQILIHEGKSLVLLSFLNFLIKRRLKIKTNIMILVQGLPKHKTILKNEKKNGTGYSFQKKEKMFSVVCRKHPEKLKKIPGFSETFYKGVTTSRHLVCQTMIKVRYRCKLLTKVNISKAQNVEGIIIQLCNEIVV